MKLFSKKINKRIYADYASSTPVDKRVLRRLSQSIQHIYGNPSAFHKEGVRAKEMLTTARETVARAIGAHADEVIFTSGGTESDNLALLGTIDAITKKFPKQTITIIVSAIEHSAIIETTRHLGESVEVLEVPVSEDGIVQVEVLKELISPTTVFVTVMHANNEIGTIQPIKEIAKLIRQERKTRTNGLPIYFHTDACQSFVYMPIKVDELGVDLLTINSSKLYAPKGVGVLYKRRSTPLLPIVFGGLQEFGFRPGTENVPLIDSFAFAVHMNESIKEKESTRLSLLQKLFIQELQKEIPGVSINGSLVDRLPNNVNITIQGVSSELIVLYLDAAGIAVSEKSACKSEEAGQSHVISALGKKLDEVAGSIRFSFGRHTTKVHIQRIVEELKKIIKMNVPNKENSKGLTSLV